MGLGVFIPDYAEITIHTNGVGSGFLILVPDEKMSCVYTMRNEKKVVVWVLRCWVSNRKNCMYASIYGVVVVENGCMHMRSLLIYFYELFLLSWLTLF